MTVTLSSVQNTLIYGINHSMQRMNELGTIAPDYLDENVSAGLDVLRTVGIGHEFETLKGPIRLLASHENIPLHPDPPIDEHLYLGENAQYLARLIYALCHRIAVEDAQFALGGLTIFDDDHSIQSLWTLETEPELSDEGDSDVLDFDTTMNVTRFAEYVSAATAIWSDYHDKIKAIDSEFTAEQRANAATLLLVQLLKSNRTVRHILRYFYLSPDFLKRFPVTLEYSQVEAYTSSKEAFEKLVKELLLAPLTEKYEVNLSEKEWRDLWRDYWRSCIGMAESYPDMESIPAEAVQQIAGMHQAWLTKVAQVAGLPYPPAWWNLWGRGWNPLKWLGRLTTD